MRGNGAPPHVGQAPDLRQEGRTGPVTRRKAVVIAVGAAGVALVAVVGLKC